MEKDLTHTGNIKETLERIFKRESLFLLAGPCVIENEENLNIIAEELVKLSMKYCIAAVFKASYSKANRSSIESYTGPGAKKGLEMLKRIRKEFSIPVITDIHTPDEAGPAGEAVDIIQIPAFLCRQTDLILSAAGTGKIVNIKKGQFVSAKEMGLAAKKALSTGNDKIMLTERGTTFGYNDLVVDFRNFMEMSSHGYPVIYDVTHSLQRPAAEGNVSGGRPEFALQMASAAVATGCVDGLFIEVHPDPQKALSDGKSMLKLEKLDELIERVLKIRNLI